MNLLRGSEGTSSLRRLFGSPDIDRNPSQAVYKSIEQVSDLAPVVPIQANSADAVMHNSSFVPQPDGEGQEQNIRGG